MTIDTFLISAHVNRCCGWVRVLGVGLSWKRNAVHPPVFSERYRHRKSLSVGGWRFSALGGSRFNGAHWVLR